MRGVAYLHFFVLTLSSYKCFLTVDISFNICFMTDEEWGRNYLLLYLEWLP